MDPMNNQTPAAPADAPEPTVPAEGGMETPAEPAMPGETPATETPAETPAEPAMPGEAPATETPAETPAPGTGAA